MPPPDLIEPGQTNPWKLFPDLSGNQGRNRFEVTLKGNPNAPEALLADTWWFVRYRHVHDDVDGTDWGEDDDRVNFTWAGAGNSDPYNDFDLDGLMDFKAQLVMGWIKRVLDAVNPYEARISDFEEGAPSTQASMISQLGARYEGAVALNPDKDVIENVGLIALYQTILERGKDLSIDLSRPVSTPAIANALQLASTRISDFYVMLGNEAYTDAQDPLIGFGSDSVEYGAWAPAVFSFQNQMSSLIEEELALLRGLDDGFASPVYNRLFWNFTKGEGEAAYAMNYAISDVNMDGFINEDDAMNLYPQGHGDAWGHYLTATRMQYNLLRHSYFNWVSRSEYYNLMDVVMKVDFLDERKFAQAAAAKAKVGAEIVDLSYRQKYVTDPESQWQGYRDSNTDRAWGVEGWSRRAGQAAYFDWMTANTLLPSTHPNKELEGIQKVDRQSNGDIAVISANLNMVQRTFDEANNGYNPLGLSKDAVAFDIDPKYLNVRLGKTHFDQIYDRAINALSNAKDLWDHANQADNRVRKIANSEAEFRNDVYQEDLAYRNRLIEIYGRPYEGTIGSGKLYPAGYDGPDLALYMYVDVREINQETVPGPTASFASFDAAGNLDGGDIYDAFDDDEDKGESATSLDNEWLELYAGTFADNDDDEDDEDINAKAQDGWYSVNYTDLINNKYKVDLDNLDMLMPVKTSDYSFQAPDDWGSRRASGKLQSVLNQMLRQEAQVAKSIAAWDALTGEIVRTLRIVDARIDTANSIELTNEIFGRAKLVVNTVIDWIIMAKEYANSGKKMVKITKQSVKESIPGVLPTVGFSISPGDALGPARGALKLGDLSVETVFDTVQRGFDIAKFAQEKILDYAQLEVDLANSRKENNLNEKEWLKEIEDLVGDEPILRIAVFKEIETLRGLSEQYRTLLDEGARLVDERAAFNKRVAAATQKNRYQDITFRVARNHALQNYRSSFDLAARYAYLAAKAYDYDTCFEEGHAGAPDSVINDIIKAQAIGSLTSSGPQMEGGLAESLAWLKNNYEALRGQLGINNPQFEVGKLSLRGEKYRIYPKGDMQGTHPEATSGGSLADALWKLKLNSKRVPNLWEVPEFRQFCRPFADAPEDGNEPGLVIRFNSEIKAGENFFGRMLSGGDHTYDPSVYATKISGVGIWFDDYESESIEDDLAESPRVYLIPAGMDVMRVSESDDPEAVRHWSVVDQSIPVPFAAAESDLDYISWSPLFDSLTWCLWRGTQVLQFQGLS